MAYSTSDGGHWSNLTSNLPDAPVSSIVVDPQDANTVYIATDEGVYFTSLVGSCALVLPTAGRLMAQERAPVVALRTSAARRVVAGVGGWTYGREIWQTQLWTAGTILTTAAASPAALTFASQTIGTTSSAQTVTLQNTGTIPLTVTSIAMGGDFIETDNCVNLSLAAGASCAIQVASTPAGPVPELARSPSAPTWRRADSGDDRDRNRIAERGSP